MPRASHWNPRYVAYATAHGRPPGDMLAHDLDRWPGGRMTGYILWITEAWRRWAVAAGHPRAHSPTAHLSKQDHVAFDKWLTSASHPSADP